MESKLLELVLVIDEPRRLLNVDLILEIAVQEHRLDVHVVHALAVVRRDGE
jgi:hypothetical protein